MTGMAGIYNFIPLAPRSLSVWGALGACGMLAPHSLDQAIRAMPLSIISRSNARECWTCAAMADTIIVSPISAGWLRAASGATFPRPWPR